MPDSKYCYPNTNVLKNKLNITDQTILTKAEMELTLIRLRELENKPINGKFDFEHLKKIHKYIFQDIYDWAGKPRTVDIGKGNLFCTVPCINEYATSVFNKYYKQCKDNKNNIANFIIKLADNYGDLNALHPFREGNGRAQREFARELCLNLGYDFDLSCTKHEEILEASIVSFNTADNSKLVDIFKRAIVPYNELDLNKKSDYIKILSKDDLNIPTQNIYNYYGYEEHENANIYNKIYKAKISKMDAEDVIETAKKEIKENKNKIHKQAKDLQEEISKTQSKSIQISR